MTVLSVAAGAAAVLLVSYDVGLTVLHPERRGPLSYVANRLTWVAAKRLARLRHGLLAAAGPLAMASSFALWVVGLWVGYALVYLPWIEGFGYSDQVAFGERGVAEALYVSGAALTTVGFGDVVAGTEALRLVTVLEGASGLAVITAAITYLLSTYGIVSDVRAAAAGFSDLRLRDVEGAAAFALHGGPSEIERLQRELIHNHQQLRRFPVLYYFHSGDRDESLLALLEAAATAIVVLRWGVRGERVRYIRPYGLGLERSFTRLLRDLDSEYIGGRRRGAVAGGARPLEEDEARARYERLRAGVAAVDDDLAAPAGDPPRELREFLGAAEGVLGALARAHVYRHEPLLAQRPA